ncbi:DUF4870 family protein [Brevundimonas sp. SL130]|uniref:DUF4870 family protein n=1 Tax=Brevundimonas sp. SL130 TaxID=2995143 RepID=UPI00226CCD33|nr:hypothetical protein [Brevundimonas sp. SL130]WAC60754.1 hypothetical protein OU998_04710 [Brevundimonas sp. SL130]
MAEPGDPKGPDAHDDDHDHDAHVGFVSPACLIGVPRAPEPQADASAQPEPEIQAEARPPERERDLFDPPEPAPVTPAFAPTSAPTPRFAADVRPAPMSLYAVYVLILLAVPTLGLSALLALLAVTGRDGPDEPLAGSHFVYQQRTLWSAAVAAVLGGLLVIVNIGVFVLFLLALWVLARGAFGVMRLKAGRPIDNPRSWLF